MYFVIFNNKTATYLAWNILTALTEKHQAAFSTGLWEYIWLANFSS